MLGYSLKWLVERTGLAARNQNVPTFVWGTVIILNPENELNKPLMDGDIMPQDKKLNVFTKRAQDHKAGEDPHKYG